MPGRGLQDLNAYKRITYLRTPPWTSAQQAATFPPCLNATATS